MSYFPTKFRSQFTISAHNIYLLSLLSLLYFESWDAVESPASEPDYLALPFTNCVVTYGRQLIFFVPQVPFVQTQGYNYMDFIVLRINE